MLVTVQHVDVLMPEHVQVVRGRHPLGEQECAASVSRTGLNGTTGTSACSPIAARSPGPSSHPSLWPRSSTHQGGFRVLGDEWVRVIETTWPSRNWRDKGELPGTLCHKHHG